jgi:hypothetical protein
MSVSLTRTQFNTSSQTPWHKLSPHTSPRHRHRRVNTVLRSTHRENSWRRCSSAAPGPGMLAREAVTTLSHAPYVMLSEKVDILCKNVVSAGWAVTVYYNQHTRSRVSSGSLVSGCGLDDRAIEVRSPAGAKDISSSLCVQTGFEAHPASCTMGTGGKSAAGALRWPLTPI